MIYLATEVQNSLHYSEESSLYTLMTDVKVGKTMKTEEQNVMWGRLGDRDWCRDQMRDQWRDQWREP